MRLRASLIISCCIISLPTVSPTRLYQSPLLSLQLGYNLLKGKNFCFSKDEGKIYIHQYAQPLYNWMNFYKHIYLCDQYSNKDKEHILPQSVTFCLFLVNPHLP